MPLWVAVHGIGREDLTPEVLNRPIIELTERTNYLRQQVDSILGAGLYQSLQLTGVALQTTGALAPAVGDVVYLNPTTQKYEKALAQVTADVSPAVGANAYALGILKAIVGVTGTVVLSGKIELKTSGAGWGLDEVNGDVGPLIETDEIFRSGAYYLSSKTAGKLTAYPVGPVIYIGYFLANTDGFGEYAILNPQHKSLSEAHLHNAFALSARPCGRHLITATYACDGGTFAPTDTHIVGGYAPDELETSDEQGGSPVTGHVYLIPGGTWRGTEAIQYSISIGNVTDTGAAADWSLAYAHWTSSDPTEGSGSTRVFSYNTPVAIGTRGLTVSFEKPTSTTSYDTTPAISTPSATGRYSWTFRAPQQLNGWYTRKWDAYLTQSTETDYLFRLIGETYTPASTRATDTITAKFFTNVKFFTISGQPTDGQTFVIGSRTFEFDSNSSVTSGNITVTIGSSELITVQNLVAAATTYFATDNFVISYQSSPLRIAIGANTTITGAPANYTLTASVTGTGDISAGEPFPVVYDRDYQLLAFNTEFESWIPLVLTNGLSIIPIPYDLTGTSSTSMDTVAGQTATVDLTDEAPGAKFIYPVAMVPALLEHFPPIPLESASLVLNGVELDSRQLFPTLGIFSVGNQGFYWHSDAYNTVPWMPGWCSYNDVNEDTDTGGVESALQYRLVAHLTRMQLSTGLVTSLRPATGSAVKITRCNTATTATSGDLDIDVQLALRAEDQNLAGYRVIKSVSGQNLLRGPVVERIFPGAGIDIQSVGGDPQGQGRIIVSASNSSLTGEFQEVALENAKQQLIGMFPYIRLLGWDSASSSNINTGFVAKFKVPENELPDGISGYRVIVYMNVFGEASLAESDGHRCAGISFDYNILPDYTPIGHGAEIITDIPRNTLVNGLITATTPFNKYVRFGTSDTAYSAYDPFLLHNDDTLTDTNYKTVNLGFSAFPMTGTASAPGGATDWTDDEFVVKPGALVGIRISRISVTDQGISLDQEYKQSIGFINLRWKLIAQT